MAAAVLGTSPRKASARNIMVKATPIDMMIKASPHDPDKCIPLSEALAMLTLPGGGVGLLDAAQRAPTMGPLERSMLEPYSRHGESAPPCRLCSARAALACLYTHRTVQPVTPAARMLIYFAYTLLGRRSVA